MLLTSLVLGAKIRTMWMTPFYLFFGLLIVYIIQSKIKLNKLKGFMISFLVLFLLSPFLYGYISITQTDKRTDYDGKKISQVIEKEWKEFAGDEVQLSHVVGDEWVAENLSYHLKSRPSWHNISKNTILLDGGFVIVNHPDLNCKSSFFQYLNL